MPINLLAQLKSVPGTADLRVHQPFDQPKIHINVDRTKAIESGFTQLDVGNSALISLSGSSQTTPEFWLDPRNGVSYSVVTQTPQFAVDFVERSAKYPYRLDVGKARRALRAARNSGRRRHH